MYVADLFMALTSSNQPVLGSITVIASREGACVFDGVLIVNIPTISTQTMKQASSGVIF
jgi:hypothetical protein